jgi:hypothetical protein
MELIPTQWKEKLPRGYSYPVGAELLSQALWGIPHYPDLSIGFSWRDTFWASAYQARLKALGDIDLIKFHRSHPDDWTISVNAVPSAHSRSARESILTIALPALRAVLLSSLVAPGYSWKATYNLASGVLRVGT